MITQKIYIALIVALILLVVGGVFVVRDIPTDNIAANSEQSAQVSYTPLQSLPGISQEGQPVTLSAALFNNLVFLIIGIAVVLAVLMIVIGGIQYMGSDAFTKKEDARNKITMALFGLLIAFGAWLLLNTINPDLVSFRALQPLKGSIKVPAPAGDIQVPASPQRPQTSQERIQEIATRAQEQGKNVTINRVPGGRESTRLIQEVRNDCVNVGGAFTQETDPRRLTQLISCFA